MKILDLEMVLKPSFCLRCERKTGGRFFFFFGVLRQIILVFYADFSCEAKTVPTEGFLHVDVSLFSAESQFVALDLNSV